LYDILTILFTKMDFDYRRSKADLQRARPSDEDLDAYFDYAKKYFVLLRKNFDDLDEFFDADDTNDVVSKHRGGHGGNALFRPIGLEIFALIIAKLNGNHSLTQAVNLASKLPRNLSEAPYAGLMW